MNQEANSPMEGEAIFSYIAKIQQGTPWGDFLDAGTGNHSLQWITGLETKSWTAVTCGEQYANSLKKNYQRMIRPEDRLVIGNWTDPTFLHGESYDVVLADYLLGAVDRFSPFFQTQLFNRLKPHVKERLYVVGLNPYPPKAETPGGELILDIQKLRDACILLGEDRCYREYPLEWTLHQLELAGFSIEDTKRFPIRYGMDFIEGQLNVCRGKLPRMKDHRLARELEGAIERLNERAKNLNEVEKGIRFGFDYAIFAKR